MARRQRKSSKKFKLRNPREIGKFYKSFDSKGGHPIRVYYSNQEEDAYFVQRFSRKDRKDRIQLSHNIDPNSSEKQWLVKKPDVIGYDDMRYEDGYNAFRIHPDDVSIIKKYQKFNLNKKKKDERCE